MRVQWHIRLKCKECSGDKYMLKCRVSNSKVKWSKHSERMAGTLVIQGKYSPNEGIGHPMTKWSNNISWSYHMRMAREIGQETKRINVKKFSTQLLEEIFFIFYPLWHNRPIYSRYLYNDKR